MEPHIHTTVTFLAQSLSAIKKHGWRSVNEAKSYGKVATVAHAHTEKPDGYTQAAQELLVSLASVEGSAFLERLKSKIADGTGTFAEIACIPVSLERHQIERVQTSDVIHTDRINGSLERIEALGESYGSTLFRVTINCDGSPITALMWAKHTELPKVGERVTATISQTTDRSTMLRTLKPAKTVK